MYRTLNLIVLILQVETLSQELLEVRGTLKKSVKDVSCQIDPIIDMTTSDVTSTDRVVPSDWVMEEQTAVSLGDITLRMFHLHSEVQNLEGTYH